MELRSLDLCWAKSWLSPNIRGLRHCELRKHGHYERNRRSRNNATVKKTAGPRQRVSADMMDMIQVILGHVFSKREILLRMCQIISFVKVREPSWETGWQQDTKQKVGQRHHRWKKLRPNRGCILISFFLFLFVPSGS